MPPLAASYVDQVVSAGLAFASLPLFWIIGGFTIAMIAFSKGAFGGGAASLGVPILSIIIDPVGAAIIVAPLVSFMDMFTLRTFGPSSWSKPDLKALLPGLIIGLGLGWYFFEKTDPRLVGLIIASVSLAFAAHWFWKRARKSPPVVGPASKALGLVAGTASGFTTFIAHAGGPPVTMYLIRRGLDKRLFVGTNTAFFTIGNALKLGPYGFLLAARPDAAAAALMLALIVPPFVSLGVRVHHRLSQDQIMLIINTLLVVGSARLLYVSVKSLVG